MSRERTIHISALIYMIHYQLNADWILAWDLPFIASQELSNCELHEMSRTQVREAIYNKHPLLAQENGLFNYQLYNL